MTRTSHARRFATLVGGLIRRTHGQDLIEYAILASIATAVGVLLLNEIGHKLAGIYDSVAQEVIADGGIGGAGGGTGGGGTGGGGTGGGGRGGGRGGN